MSPDDFKRVRSLFHKAFDLSPGDAAAMLERECAGRNDVRSEVESLLRANRKADNRFDPIDGSIAQQLLTQAAGWDGDDAEQIGPYRIVRRIGQGGMGVVYLARQSHPEREVALKVLRGAVAPTDLRKRFEREVRLLGQLRHPGIAQIYEAGVAEAPGGGGKLPYFAMEYVDGLPLTKYADTRRLGTDERLDLFVKVCDAVQHAHQKGVIHRDLKPANILVVDEVSNDAPVGGMISFPKILDFGVARLTDSDLQTATMQTDVGQLVGTIPYMSPEQVLGDSRLLDVRSDVYALGVVLYELLAGRLPLDLRERSIPDATRMIREEEPSRLSSIDTRFRGDVETIVAKAMEKDRERRYQSAGDLAADVRHYLREEPILARPATAAYRFRKYARRNKVLVASGAVVLVVLITGIISTSIGLVRARSAEKRAIAEAGMARTINAFLNEDIIAAVEKRGKGHDVGMREILDESAKRIEARFEAQPAAEAEIRCSLGQAYKYLGALESAQEHLERGLALVRNGARMSADSHIQIILNLAILRTDQGRHAEAQSLLNEGLQESIRINGETDWRTLLILNSLALNYQRLDRHADAEALLERLIKIRRTMGDANGNQRELLTVMSNLGTLYRNRGRLDEAISLQAEVLEKGSALLGPESGVSLKCAYELGGMLRQRGRLDEAESRLVPLEKTMRRKMGESHPHTLIVMGELSSLRRDQGRLDEALRLRIENVEGLKRALGETHANTQASIGLLAELYDAMNRPQDAASWRAKLISAAATAATTPTTQ